MTHEASTDSHGQLQPEAESNHTSPLKRILHPTDFSPESYAAFVHALKLAVTAQAELDILHIEQNPTATDLERFPSVRETLARWSILPDGATQADVAKLGITVRKVSLQAESPSLGIMQHLGRHAEDLIVLATHHRHGIDRWFHPDIATRIALKSHVSTLFVPDGCSGFVDGADGGCTLKRVVLPVDDVPSPQTAIDLAAYMMRVLGANDSEPTFSVMHVGPRPMTGGVKYPADADWNWEWLARGEDVVDDIVSVTAQKSADLIAMTTQGHTCWKDILSGCTTENVVHKAPCPVLAVYALEPEPLQKQTARTQPASNSSAASG